MKRRILLFYILGILCFFSCQEEMSKENSAEYFFHSEKKSHFRISPNGKYISYLEDYKGIKNIFILDLATGNSKRITSETEREVEFAFWANDDELIYLINRGLDDSLLLMVVNRANLQSRSILSPGAVKLRWIGPIQVINNEILVSMNDRDSSMFDVYRLNISTGNRNLIGLNPGNIVRWLTDYDGQLRLAVVSDGLTETILVRNNEQSDFQPVINNIYKTKIQPLGFTQYNRDRIYALSNQNRDKLALVEIDLNTGKEIKLLYQHPDVDLNAEGYSKQSGAMEFVEYDAQRPEKHFIDHKLKDVFSKLNNQIPNYLIKLIARDSMHSGFLVQATKDTDAGAIYYYNYNDNKLLKLSEESPRLNSDKLAPMKPIEFYTRDGFKLFGYLTIPKNLVGKNPAIIIPPRGINSRAVWGYNPEVQYLASRGYIVLQVNTRGIKGYGKEHWFEGFKKWGTTMQNDITDATNWLIKQGIVDESKIGIYGFNLGGYSALHMSCYNPELYACAASYSGITNLFTYLKEIPPYYLPYRQMFYEMVGDPVKDSEYFRKHSPIFHTDKIKQPIFIAQGSNDNRSNVTETNQFVKDLRDKGISVTYVLKDEEGHYFENEYNKIFLYEKLASFFDKHLK